MDHNVSIGGSKRGTQLNNPISLSAESRISTPVKQLKRVFYHFNPI